MRRLTTPWKLALASLGLTITLLALTTWVFPPGKQNAAASMTLHDLINEHLGELDQRLWTMDVNGGPQACEFTWRDSKREGLRTYTFDARFHLATYDPIRQDWVDTCDDTTEYYALELESSYTGAFAPRLDQYVMHRVTHLSEPDEAR